MISFDNKSDIRIKNVSFSNDYLIVELMDGRILSVPTIWYPRLFHATKNQRENWKISGGGYGISWDDIDEDLSSEGLLAGSKSPELKEFA